MFRHFNLKNVFKSSSRKGSKSSLSLSKEDELQQQPSKPPLRTYLDETQLIEETFKKSTVVLTSPNRLPNDRYRDSLRNPQQILTFLGIQPNDRILDFSSWDGYWATLFVPLTELPVWCQNVESWKQFCGEFH
jgi:hypothetical protein